MAPFELERSQEMREASKISHIPSKVSRKKKLTNCIIDVICNFMLLSSASDETRQGMCLNERGGSGKMWTALN